MSGLDLSWITPWLAVGGCVPPEGVPALRRAGLGAVIDLRDEGCDDARALRRCGIRLLHLPTPDLAGPTPWALRAGVERIEAEVTRDRRVLVHCRHGIGRSATLALCALVARGFEPLAALELLKQKRPCISPSPEQYEAFARWLEVTRHAAAPGFNEFAAIAYRHLRAGAPG